MARKVRPGDRITQLMLAESDYTVTAGSVLAMFRADPKLAPTDYKISGYIGDIRKYHGGVVKVTKNGRKVLSYTLMNPWEFDNNGHRLQGDALKAAQESRDMTKPIRETANSYTQIVVDVEPEVPEVVVSVVSDPIQSDEGVPAETNTDDQPGFVAAEDTTSTDEAEPEPSTEASAEVPNDKNAERNRRRREARAAKRQGGFTQAAA